LPIITSLQKAQNEHLIKDVEPQIILSSITGTVFEILRYYQSKGKKPSKSTINQCFEMAWTSIRK
jgi:hypothetical protein